MFVAKIQFECGQFRVVLFRYRGIEKNRIYDNTIALWIVHRSKPCKIFWPGVSCLYPNTHNTLRATTHKNPGMLFTGRDVIFQSTELEKLAFFVSFFVVVGKLSGRKQIKVPRTGIPIRRYGSELRYRWGSVYFCNLYPDCSF